MEERELSNRSSSSSSSTFNPPTTTISLSPTLISLRQSTTHRAPHPAISPTISPPCSHPERTRPHLPCILHPTTSPLAPAIFSILSHQPPRRSRSPPVVSYLHQAADPTPPSLQSETTSAVLPFILPSSDLTRSHQAVPHHPLPSARPEILSPQLRPPRRPATTIRATPITTNLSQDPPPASPSCRPPRRTSLNPSASTTTQTPAVISTTQQCLHSKTRAPTTTAQFLFVCQQRDKSSLGGDWLGAFWKLEPSVFRRNFL